jgi:shikimate kinase
MKNSISLIGMAGAGKSSIGIELAKRLDCGLVDSEGYIKLREIENLIIKNIHFDGIVLSTGGSAVYSDEAMKHIQKYSKVIFLEVPFTQILERVPSFLDRGFAKAPSQSVEDAFQERQDLYKKYSHFTVSNTNDLHSCVLEILKLL